jgi:hypothetical protein
MKATLLVSLLLVSAAAITPSYANYFSNPRLGVTLNVGSAANPTPRDIRESRMPLAANTESTVTAKVDLADKATGKQADRQIQAANGVGFKAPSVN